MAITAKKMPGSATKIRIPARLSYANIWEPRSMSEGQKPKYSTSIIIPKDDEDTLALINECIEEAWKLGKDKFGKAWPASIQATKTPLHDGDLERPEDPAYQNGIYLNASSDRAPKIVGRDPKVPIDNPEEVYSGCYANVTVNFYAFNSNGNRGIAAGLNNIQKIRDGERLGGASTPEEDFEVLDEEYDDDYGF